MNDPKSGVAGRDDAERTPDLPESDLSPALKVAVLMGGTSGEREVSLASGSQVARALAGRGHRVVGFDTTKGVLSPAEIRQLTEGGVKRAAPPPESLDLLETGDTTALTRAPEVTDVDLIFPALHGGTGEDGTLQSLLDLVGIPYAGSGRLGCTLAMDKEVSKMLFRSAGIPTPDWLNESASLDRVVAELGLPVIVKPPSGGSTLGLTLAHDRAELESAVEEARRYQDRIMFERYIPGREFTVAILGEEALPVGEIIPAHELFDYECKYQPGLCEEIFPADLDEATSARMRELALRVHKVLFMRDFSRVDFILDAQGNPWCLEANALPGMTANSLLPKAAAAAGIPFPELCERMVRIALARVSGSGAGSSSSA
jgi:D-alanine-D-alanine ligase